MMTPLRRASGGGDQEKVTCLSPGAATNISGAPAGAVVEKINTLNTRNKIIDHF